MLESILTEENPWWKSKDEIYKDKKLVELNKSIFSWDPRIRHKIEYTKDIVYSLRGPRQVGKTTLIKIQIKDFLEKDVSPWNIMYYAFDLEDSPKEVVKIIKNYLDNTKRRRGESRCYVFLDEISSVKNWQKAIKNLWDKDKLANCTIVVTGSHSIDLKMAHERLPGRKGETNEAYDKIMLPMKFSEYCSIIDNDLKNLIEKNFRHNNDRIEIFKKLLKNEIDPKIEEASSFSSELNRYLLDYMVTGGIPNVINDYLKNGYINEYTYTTYFDSIIGDINYLDIDERKFKKLIANIIKDMSFPTSWNALQKDTDIGSWHTVDRYINLLRDMFIITVFYQYDSEKKGPLQEKAKKIHFHDVFFFHTLNTWTSPHKSFELSKEYVLKEDNQGHLIEGIIGDHLIRLSFNISERKQRFDYSNYLFYWRYHKDKEKEVDYIFYNGQEIEIPIEVKFTNRISNRDLDGIFNFKKYTGVKNGLIISKESLEAVKDYVKIPAYIFLLLI